MNEAPDHRENEDCPSAEVCEHGCDQHPKLVELKTETEKVRLLQAYAEGPIAFLCAVQDIVTARMADAWDEGFTSGFYDPLGGSSAHDASESTRKNPYQAEQAAAALKDTARMLSNRPRALQRVEMFVEELAAADDGTNDKEHRLGRFVVSELRAALAEPERDEEPEEIHHCDGCGEDYNILAESHVGHQPERDEEGGND